MELKAFVAGNVEGAMKRLREGLESAGFVFSETDRSYLLTRPDTGGINQHLCGSTFWARKQLSAPQPRSHAIEIEGAISTAEELVCVRVDLCEFHGQRKHSFGGSQALETFVESFSRMLFEPPST